MRFLKNSRYSSHLNCQVINLDALRLCASKSSVASVTVTTPRAILPWSSMTFRVASCFSLFNQTVPVVAILRTVRSSKYSV